MTPTPQASAERPRQGHLSGPSVVLDRRVHAVRDDLADIALADRILAPRYGQSCAMQCVAANAMLRAAPDPAATATSALLFGEHFAVFDIDKGWAWGQCGHDGYVGYVEAAALGNPGAPATHRVSVPTALVFGRPDIKAPVLTDLPFNARVAGVPHDEKFVAAAGGFVHVRHLSAIGADLPLPLDAARLFTGSPYLWGGRTCAGVDCSGLVQAALRAAGQAAPRDSDQQATTIGVAVALADRAPGDLLFVPGHVGFIDHGDNVLHANAYWMQTLSEPLAAVLARLPADTVVNLRRPLEIRP